MSRLDDVLRRGIDEDLAYDLTTMSRNDDNGKGVGYPLLMSSCAGIEFLGGLLSATPFDARNGAGARFVGYWESYLYPPPSPYADRGKAMYRLVRNGIAHSYTVKGSIWIHRRKPALHFTCDSSGELHIDAVKLACDFLESYRLRVKPLLTDPTSEARGTAMERLLEMETAYREDAEKHDYPSRGAVAERKGPDSGPTGPR